MTHPAELSLFRRVAEAVGVALILSFAYFAAGHWTAPHGVPLEHLYDDRIPFVPASVWIYLPGYWACFLIPVLVIRDGRQFRAALTGLTLLTVLAAPFFVLFPVAAPRAPAPGDASLTSAMVRWLYATDPAGNTFPSLHVANATFCAMVTTAVNRRWGMVVWGLAVGVAISVLTLKQHWMVDIPAAWGLAAVGLATWRAQLAGRSGLSGLVTRVAARLSGSAPGAAPSLQRARTARRRSRP